jgi:hypothetical protein
MPTNVPQPTFGPNGFIAPTQAQILAGVFADMQTAFGGNLNPALNTPQGQLASSMAAIVGNVYDDFLFYTTQTDPAFAEGRMQDAIARIYFLERNPAEPTTLQVRCNGAVGVAIPLGALVQDNAGNTYACTQSGVISSSGFVVLSFANILDGPIAVPAANAVTIYQAIPGWDSVAVNSGVIGVNTETQSQFETRRAASVAQNSIGSLPSIRGAVLAVPGVLDAYVTENTSSGTATIGGVVLVANSIYVAVSGGSAGAVATAIWSKKAPGCAYNGNTTVIVQDANSGYSAPYPSYNVSFTIPFVLPIFFAVNIRNSPQVPSDALSQVQNALLTAFAGNDGGTKAGIGSILYATRYIPNIASLGTWAQVVSLQIGSSNTPVSVFSGSASGTTLNVTSIVSGTLGGGHYLVSGTAVSGSAVLSDGTKIIIQVSGTVGGVGFYTINNAQTIPTQQITAVLADQSFVGVNIDQEPTLIAVDIGLNLV